MRLAKKESVEITFVRCFQAYDKFQFTDYPEVKSDALIACHMKMLLKLIGCAVRVIAGVVNLMLGVPDSDEL